MSTPSHLQPSRCRHGTHWTWRVAVAGYLWTLLALSATAEQAATPKLQRLLERSGTVAQVVDWPGVTKAGFDRGVREGGRIPDTLIAQMLASADKHLDPNAILHSIRASVGDALNDRSLDFLLDWYESDTGRRITAAEKSASTAEAYAQFVEQIPVLLLNRERLAAARRIDKLVSATDRALEMQAYTGIALYSAMMTAIAPDQPLDLNSYREQSRAMQRETRQNTEQFVLASLIYSYQLIDDDSLREYERFLAHPTARRFNVLAFDGIMHGTQQVMSAWSQDIARIMGRGLAGSAAQAP